MKASFAHVTTWVFDLDNTLYPAGSGLFPQIERRMTEWVMRHLHLRRADADALRQHYWQTHGTTLAGLMREHRIDPTAYLDEVHAIDFSMLTPNPALRAGLAALPGRRIVYTNADVRYAARALSALNLTGLFDAVYGVEEAGYHPKPDRAAYDIIFARDGLTPTCAAMFEDDPHNLRAPHAMGLQTVHVAPEPQPAAHIHHHTADLAGFLADLTR